LRPRRWSDPQDKFFFFVNYEEFRLPQQALRTTQILTRGRPPFYKSGSGSTAVFFDQCIATGRTKGFPTTTDPTVSKLLGDISLAAGTTEHCHKSQQSESLDFKI